LDPCGDADGRPDVLGLAAEARVRPYHAVDDAAQHVQVAPRREDGVAEQRRPVDRLDDRDGDGPRTDGAPVVVESGRALSRI
jgi:hypothetical protein